MSDSRQRFGMMAKACVFALLVLAAQAILPMVAAADDGRATWYGQPFHGRTMYNGQVFDMYDPSTTAANMFPIGTWLSVTNPLNGHNVVVQVRDRGAFKHALDLSYGAFAALDNPNKMVIQVQFVVVSGPGGAPVDPPASPPSTPPAQKASPAQPAPPKPPAPSAPPTEYVVAKGDTLYSIASRFSLSVISIVKWNAITDSNRIDIGQKLRLTEPANAPVVAPTSRSESPAGRATAADIYTVVRGDTLWSIATENGTTPEKLAALNNLADANIFPGQRLSLDAVGSGGPPASRPAKKSYTVREGDSLLAIALDNGTTMQALANANSLANVDLLQPGQVLVIP